MSVIVWLLYAEIAYLAAVAIRVLLRPDVRQATSGSGAAGSVK
jgi:hypothetical protein